MTVFRFWSCRIVHVSIRVDEVVDLRLSEGHYLGGLVDGIDCIDSCSIFTNWLLNVLLNVRLATLRNDGLK